MASESSAGDDEDLAGNLSNYRLQLQQVEAALTTDPDNEDLVKLKNDLEEVIALTEDLLGSNQVTTDAQSAGSTKQQGLGLRYPGRGLAAGGSRDTDRDEARDWLRGGIDWKSGDKCRAMWTDSSGETGYYPATVDEILDDGSCSVIFDRYGTTEVTQVMLLRPVGGEDSDEEKAGKSGAADKPKSKRDLTIAQREYKRKKQQKKAQRLKQYEDEREDDKNKWINFNSKVFAKTTKGRVKKSIFASPDGPTPGKVGIGTCGVSGRPMTKFTHMEKWKK